jgi:hypothetical protein
MAKPSGKKIADFACVQPSRKGPAIDPHSIPFFKTSSHCFEFLVSGAMELNNNGYRR